MAILCIAVIILDCFAVFYCFLYHIRWHYGHSFIVKGFFLMLWPVNTVSHVFRCFFFFFLLPSTLFCAIQNANLVIVHLPYHLCCLLQCMHSSNTPGDNSGLILTVFSTSLHISSWRSTYFHLCWLSYFAFLFFRLDHGWLNFAIKVFCKMR